MRLKEKVLFIGDGSEWSVLAAGYLKKYYVSLQAIFWDYGSKSPTSHLDWKGDRIFTFKADLILTPSIIGSAAKSAINFHPSTPDYRGVGGYYYALADNRNNFGATCHHIDDQIDHGKIIAVDRFLIYRNEDVESLKERTALACLGLFHRIVHQIYTAKTITYADHEIWGRKLYTRKGLERFAEQKPQRSLLASV